METIHVSRTIFILQWWLDDSLADLRLFLRIYNKPAPIRSHAANSLPFCPGSLFYTKFKLCSPELHLSIVAMVMVMVVVVVVTMFMVTVSMVVVAATMAVFMVVAIVRMAMAVVVVHMVGQTVKVPMIEVTAAVAPESLSRQVLPLLRPVLLMLRAVLPMPTGWSCYCWG